MVAAVLAASAALLLASGCGGTSDGADGERTLTVLAASSLTESFDELATSFESDHPGVEVRLTYDSSTTLAQQVVAGAPADVLATADARSMQTAVDGEAIEGEPRELATNRLVLVVPAGNPADIGGLPDLARDDVTFVMCDPSAPCGAIGQAVLDANGVDATPSSLEPDVKAVLTKVTLDEADAGLVYASDAVAAGDAVRSFPVPDTAEAVTRYLVAPVADSSSPELAREWIDLLLSDKGQKVLSHHGFGAP